MSVSPARRFARAVLAVGAVVVLSGCDQGGAARPAPTASPTAAFELQASMPPKQHHLPANIDFCPYHGQPWGYAGRVRPGMQKAARKALGSDLQAEVHDPNLGTVDLAQGTRNLTDATRTRLFSAWRPVLAQSEQPALHSCNFLLADKAAAQRLGALADAAVRARGLYTASKSIHMFEEEISDNPFASDSVIVTVRVSTGRAEQQHGTGPPISIDDHYTVIENHSTAAPTSVTRGGL